MGKNIIAIDPGKSGGIACLNNDMVLVFNMPETEGDVVDLLRMIRSYGCQEAVIEEVGGFCGVGQPGSRMFTFGRGVGVIHGALLALGFRIDVVRPARWQKHFSLGTVKSAGGKTAWKNKLKGCAQRLYPSVAVNLHVADALLILDYAANKKD